MLDTMRSAKSKRQRCRRVNSRGLIPALFQPPDAENRTSGGVGASTGSVPSGRPDHRPHVAQFAVGRSLVPRPREDTLFCVFPIISVAGAKHVLLRRSASTI